MINFRYGNRNKNNEDVVSLESGLRKIVKLNYSSKRGIRGINSHPDFEKRMNRIKRK